MKVLTVLLTLCISTVRLDTTNTHSSLLQHIIPRITNGQNAAVGQFPWQVAVYFLVGSNTYLCGGSLIGTQWVLTAAHCVDGATIFQIVLGTNNLQTIDPNSVTVVSTIAYKHPSYSSATLANDIGVIKIPAVTLTAYIQTIPIWHNVVQPNTMVTISGFGRTSSTLPYGQLKFAILKTVQGVKFCAQGNNYESPCDGDSGGPVTVTVNGVTSQVGIMSFESGFYYCTSPYPHCFTEARNYLNWLKAVTGLNL